MREVSDQELVLQSLNGDNGAFDKLVLRYQLPMYRTALNIVDDSDLAYDVTQAGFLKSWEKLHTYNTEYRFYSWLYRIIINEALNKKRSVHKMEKLSNESYDQNPYSDLVEKEEKEKLHIAINQLPSDQKIIIHLRHFEELSYREIATILEIEEKTVKSRLFSARMRLRDLLNSQ